MGRIIGIDYGTKRIGLAVTDPLQIFASPLETVGSADFFTFIENYIRKEPVDSFVIGYPVTLNNIPSDSVKSLDPFLKKLKKLYPGKEVHLVDERFTSQIAMRTMIDGGIRKTARRDKALVDRISASIILQSFLDSRQNKLKTL
jgi:putative holliday junction resolvase